MKVHVTFLGTGTSHGIPMVACDCPVCTSSDPRNNRHRASVLVRTGENALLIDTTPELRLQLIRADVRRVDAIAFTHAHADHIFGLDDIRRINEINGTAIPCYGHRQTMKAIYDAFRYIFVATQAGGGKPRLDLNVVNGPFEAAGMTIKPIPVWHGKVKVLGYRIGDFAYITDVSRIPPDSVELLKGIDTLALGVLRFTPHPTHFNFDQGLTQIAELNPRRAYITHIAHEFDHAAVSALLPPGVEMAYDGLEIEL